MSVSAIKRQVEYYFADFNLMRDQFLKNEIKLSKEAGKDGFISLDIMLKFNKLAQLTTDKEKILSCIAESKLVEVNEDKSGIRRNPERKLPIDDEIYRAGLKARTCYVEGFPRDSSHSKKVDSEDKKVEDKENKTEGEDKPAEEVKAEIKSSKKSPVSETNVNLDQIFAFFDKYNYQVETIAMRRLKNPKEERLRNRFTGSIFITFNNQSEAERFLASEEKFSHDNAEFELTKMSKAMYWSMQNAKNDAQKKGGNVEAAMEAAKKAAERAQIKPIKFESGIAIKFTGVKDGTIRREDIKEFITESEGACEYISFESGKDSGLLLLNYEHGKKGAEVIKESEVTKNIKGNDLVFSFADEKEFDSVHTEFLAFRKKQELLKLSGGKKKKFGKSNRGAKNYKGNKVDRNTEPKNNRKRFADSDDEGVPEKVAKAEE